MRKIILLSVFSFGFPLWATPTLKNHCGIKLSEPAMATGVHFDEGCKTAYVKPPHQGEASIRALAPNMNLQFCPALKQAGVVAENNLKAIRKVSEKVLLMIDDYEPFQKQIEDLRPLQAKTYAALNVAKKAASNADDRLITMRQELRLKEVAFSDCEIAHGKGNAGCIDLGKDVQTLRSHIKWYQDGEYRTLKTDVTRKELAYEEIQSEIRSLNEKYVAAIKPMYDLLDQMATLEARNAEIYADYGRLEGATGQILYDLAWEKLVQSYRDSNSDLDTVFVAMPIKDATLWASLAGVYDSASRPAIVSTRVPGLSPAGYQGIGAGNAVGAVSANPSIVDSTLQGAMMTTLAGEVRLSLIGACPFFQSATEPAKDLSRDELTAYLSMNLTYTYELSSRRGYDAKYQLAQLMKRFEEHKKQYGFFSTKVIHRVIEENDSKDWFDIQFIADSGEFNYSPEEQAQLSQTIKAELIDRALRQVSTFAAGSAPALPLRDIPTSGASFVAGKLVILPFWWAQAGGIVLGVLDSIFGSSTAVSEFVRNNNLWVRQSVNGVSFVDRSYTVTFAKPITQ